MADTAHFTSTSSANPSIFEILAQASLQNTLHPALQKVSLFAATCSPRRFGWLANHYEEAFLVLNGLLQYHYLKNYGASFAENFYGLKRVTVLNTAASTKDLRASLIFLVLLPYLKRKFENSLQAYRLEYEEDSLKDDFIKLLLRLHSVCEVGWSSWLIVNYLRYMCGSAQSQLPSLHMLGLKLSYADEELDNVNFWGRLLTGKLSLSEFSLGLVKNAVGTTLELVAFFMQFLQAWNAEKSNFDVTALPAVVPPAIDNQADGFKGKCPICLQNWKIPTILPVSGYVFCFPCIFKHLRENQRCPVTNLPAKPLDIVRLYDNE